jgi:hypothetical protein
MKNGVIFQFSLIGLLFLFNISFAESNENEDYSVDLLVGQVQISHDNGTNWENAEIDTPLFDSDILKTGANSYCEITLPNDQGSFRIMDHSYISLNKLGKNSVMKIEMGNALFDITKKLLNNESFEVQTVAAVATVRGTEFYVEGNGESGSCSVVNGEVTVRRNIRVEQDEELKNDITEALEVKAGENQEVEFTKTENSNWLSSFQKFRGDRVELRKFLRNERLITLKKLRAFRHKERLIKIIKLHREQRQQIIKRRIQFRKQRLEKIQEKRQKHWKRQ